MKALFALVAEGGITTAERIRRRLSESGIQPEDFRLRGTMQRLEALADQPIGLEAFARLVGPELLMLKRALSRQLVIPDWLEFSRDIKTIYDRVAADRSGANADYIPILRDADPERWGLAVCSVDGQRLRLGDVDVYHSIQSVSKPITYACALEREGLDFTHQYVGVEPSGRPFNALDLMPDLRPFNPCVNSGAIMTAGILASGWPELDAMQITERIMALWTELSGANGEVRFSAETMRSEKETAHNNFAIAYLLQGRKGLPRNVEMAKMMDLYLSCCSIEMTADMLSVAAATLANGGVCPITGRVVLSTDVVKKTLSVMQSSGMYDNAGHFTLEVGLPAKSGVAGAVLVVVPNLMGFATFSPRLDAYGNSVRGVGFCRQLVERFTFHVYDSLSGGRTGCKRDPRASQHTRKQRDLSDLRWALAYGDAHATRVCDLVLACMVAISLADGAIDTAELDAIAATAGAIIGSVPNPDELERLVQQYQAQPLQSPFATLIDELVRQRQNLDDNGRELILEAAFRVACADGVIAAGEEVQLRQIAAALEISEGVLELEIDRFLRQQQPVAVAVD